MSSLGVHRGLSVDWLLSELPGSAHRRRRKLPRSSACCKSEGRSPQATRRRRPRGWTADSLMLLLCSLYLWTLVSELTASFAGVPSFTDPHYCPWPGWHLNSATVDWEAVWGLCCYPQASKWHRLQGVRTSGNSYLLPPLLRPTGRLLLAFCSGSASHLTPHFPYADLVVLS